MTCFSLNFNPFVASPPIAKHMRRISTTMNDLKAIVWVLVFLVIVTGAPPLAAKGLRHDTSWHAREQKAALCRQAIVGTCVPATIVVPRGYAPKQMQNDDWPANLNLG
jgi:hypothetical protein